MVEVLMGLALAFGITFYAIPAIIHAATRKMLFDFPDERKIHKQPVPSLGGLGIFAGFITAFLLTVSFAGELYRFQYIIAALLIIFFVGLKDDLLNISPLKKFLGQVLAAAILIFKGGFVITSMDGLLGIYELPEMAAYILTMVVIVFIINAYNLIDGVDGLASGLSIVSAVFFAIFFGVNGNFPFACIATALIGSLAAFLIFNVQPARIFMGDSGSMVLGLLHAVLGIHFITTAPEAPVWSVGAAPAVAFAIMFVPLFDTLRVFSFRILRGMSPFTPDRNHIHHILLRFKLSHRQVALILAGAGLLIPFVTWWTVPIGTNWIFLSLLAVGFTTIGVLLVIYRRKIRSRIISGGLATGKKSTRSALRAITSSEPRKVAGSK